MPEYMSKGYDTPTVYQPFSILHEEPWSIPHMQVETSDGESARPRLFRVIIKWAANVKVQKLMDFVRYAGS